MVMAARDECWCPLAVGAAMTMGLSVLESASPAPTAAR